MKEKRYEAQVGLFVVVGLVVIAVMVVGFGNFDKYLKEHYEIAVEFPDASGLLKDSQVLYRGAKVGWVEGRPEITELGEKVMVRLKIHAEVRIPKEASFVVGSYGLLGDRFVDVIPPAQGGSSAGHFSNGDTAEGSRVTGISDIASKAEPVLAELKPTIENIRASTEKIREELDELLTDDFRSDIQLTVKETRESIERLNAILADMQKSEGTFSLLMKDREMSGDIKETVASFKAASEEAEMLVSNLRKRGILFYSDLAGKEQAKAEKEAAEAKRRAEVEAAKAQKEK